MPHYRIVIRRMFPMSLQCEDLAWGPICESPQAAYDAFYDQRELRWYLSSWHNLMIQVLNVTLDADKFSVIGELSYRERLFPISRYVEIRA